MKLTQTIGLVFHKLIDWKTHSNPITDKLFPEFYVIRWKKFMSAFKSKRKLSTTIVFTMPYLDILITAPMRSNRCIFYPFVIQDKTVEGSTDETETGF